MTIYAGIIEGDLNVLPGDDVTLVQYVNGRINLAHGAEIDLDKATKISSRDGFSIATDDGNLIFRSALIGRGA